MKENEVYVMVALRRKKDKENEFFSASCHKVVVKNEDFEYAEERLRKLCDEGCWRVYRTVNKRDLTKALKLLQIEMITKPESIKDKIDSVWKSILMKPQCKAERNFLIDIDDKSVSPEMIIKKYLPGLKGLEIVSTPNGYHIVVPPFDTRELLKDYGDKIEVKKDALVYKFSI